MSRTRPSRAAARTLRLLLLASLVMLGPLAAAPSHAWTPPPAPLPIEPGDTDGQPFELPDRPNPGHEATRLGSAATQRNRQAEEAGMATNAVAAERHHLVLWDRLAGALVSSFQILIRH